MRPRGPTHWLLNRLTGWRTAACADVSDDADLKLLPTARAGTWTSLVLDSRIDRCAWDRVELAFSDMPEQCVVTVETASFDQSPWQIDERDWTRCGEHHAPNSLGAHTVDWPVRSRPGRYLAVRLRLSGHASGTPAVHALRVHYPRASWLDFLPAVFRADDESRDLLDRFLGALARDWDPITARIRDLPAALDPGAVPGGVRMRLLASWFGIALTTGPVASTETLQYERERRMLRAGIAASQIRGTPAALRILLIALLTNLTDVDVARTHYPVLLEGGPSVGGWFVLGRPDRAVLCGPTRLWGAEAVGRLQIGTYSQVGKAKLIGVGDPAKDAANVMTTGHHFRVFLPSAWLDKPGVRSAVVALIEAERPATASYELCEVAGQVVVGQQSMVGVDTIVSPPPCLPPRRDTESR
jgi:phage tail-like protein